MKRRLVNTMIAAALAWPGLAAAQGASTDPIVEHRMSDRQANADYRQRKTDAKAEHKAERRANVERAAAAEQQGKDPIVEHRMLNRDSRSDYRQARREARAEHRAERRANAERADEALGR